MLTGIRQVGKRMTQLNLRLNLDHNLYKKVVYRAVGVPSCALPYMKGGGFVHELRSGL